MFHVEQNKKNLHCETKDYLVTGERFRVYLDENKIIGKTIPVPKKAEMYKYYDSNQYLPHSLNKKNFMTILYSVVKKQMHRKKLGWMSGHLKQNSNVLDYGCGSGDFVKYLRSRSVRAYGYDPNIKFSSNEPAYLTNNSTWEKKKIRHHFSLACFRTHPQPIYFASKSKKKSKQKRKNLYCNSQLQIV